MVVMNARTPTSTTVTQLLNGVLSGVDLTATEAGWVMHQVIAGTVDPVQLAGLLVALRAKGETVDELVGLTQAILSEAVPVPVSDDAIDVVGTGGDQAHTVNISTMASIVVAGAGIRVVKSGNRSVSSKCGATDVLEVLGIPPDLSPRQVARCVEEVGIGYLHAPHFHPGFRNAVPTRRALGVATVFNFVGPLINPVQPRARSVGCASLQMAPMLAEVLAQQGCSALVARGEDGLDEISTTAPTRVWIVAHGRVEALTLDAADLGLPRSRPEDLRGGDAYDNAAVVHRLLEGERGSVRDVVLINAAAAIAAYRGVVGSPLEALGAGLREAEQSLSSGAARDVLRRWGELATSAGEESE